MKQITGISVQPPSISYVTNVNSSSYRINYFLNTQSILPSVFDVKTEIKASVFLQLLIDNKIKYEVLKTGSKYCKGVLIEDSSLLLSLFDGSVLLSTEPDDHHETPLPIRLQKKKVSEFIYSIEILYDFDQKEEYEKLFELLKSLPFKKENKKSVIHIVCQSMDGLWLKEVDVKKTNINIELNYNEDFKEINKNIITNINKKGQNGIILLYGVPGTGKTNYIRYLLTKAKKKVIYLPPNLASELSSPGFITFLADHTDSVLVIEDGENVIKSRKGGGSQSIANLLNLSDGLLADVLKTQILATFNCNIEDVDEALLRKGRLLAKYEFRELEKKKAQVLSDKLGFDTKITKEMTLAEIYNQDKPDFKEEKSSVGFKLGR